MTVPPKQVIATLAAVLFVAACQPSTNGDLPVLFQMQNQCFIEVGVPPVQGPEGGRDLTEAQYAIYRACLDRLNAEQGAG